MTGGEADLSALITLADVAGLAGVSRPAVSNWRKRFLDFPQPAAGTPGSPLFHLQEVEDWLRSRDKWVGRPGAEHQLWAALESLRAFGPTELFLDGFSAILTLRFVALVPQQARNAAQGAVLDQEEAWNATRHSPGGDRLSELTRFATQMEASAPSLRDMLVPPIRRLPREAARLVDLLDMVTVEDSPSLLEAVISMHRRATGRGGLEWTSSEALTELVVNLARPIASTVYDGAAGAGGFLLAAAHAAEYPLDLHGQEINEGAWRLGNQRLIVHQLDGHIARGDTLLADAYPGLEAQTVLLDPPYGMSNWGGDGAGYDRSWPFGVPSANNADFAWIQQAISHLAPGGRAFVLSPMSSLFRTGADARIRHELIRAGALDAVFALPRGLVSRTAIPLALWVLARPNEAAGGDRILLVDAAAETPAGFAGRAKEIVDLYHQWRKQGTAEVVGWAATPSRLDLLGIDANLSPARWIPTALESVDATDLLRDLRHDIKQLTESLNALRHFGELELKGVGASRGPVQRASVGRLVTDGRLGLTRGARVPREEFDAEGDIAVITASQVQDGAELPSADCPRLSSNAFPERTEPGDVVVLTDGVRIRAAVVSKGGAIVAAPLWLIRVRGDWIASAYLAACLASAWNLRHSSGTTIPRAPVRELEIPLLPLTSQHALVDQVSVLQHLRRQAAGVEQSSEAIIQQLVDGVTAGVLDVSATSAGTPSSDAPSL